MSKQRLTTCPKCSCDLSVVDTRICPKCGTRWTDEQLRLSLQMRFPRGRIRNISDKRSWERLAASIGWRIGVMLLLWEIASELLEVAGNQNWPEYVFYAMIPLLGASAHGYSLIHVVRRYRDGRVDKQADQDG